MKIDDLSLAYHPLVHETDVWPFPLSDCPPHACPYDVPRGSGGSLRLAQPSWATGARLTQELPVSVPMAVQAVGGMATASAVKKRHGYCECCATRYEDLSKVSWGEETTCGSVCGELCSHGDSTQNIF